MIEKSRKRVQEYIINNSDKFKETKAKSQRKRRQNPINRFKENIRTRVRNSFASNTKKSKSIAILGCSLEDFRTYIESKFEPWMNWNNYGNWNGTPKEINTSWDLDHIIPISKASSEEDIIALNHYTNFQPLCSYTNRCVKPHHKEITNS